MTSIKEDKDIKEIVIPITHETLAKVLFLLFGVLSFTVGIYGILINEYAITVVSFLMGDGLVLAFTLIASWEYNWDLNPFHKIGYCIRLMEEYEDKKESKSK